MKQFSRYFVIGIPIGAIIGLPLLGFKLVSLKTLLVSVAIFEIGAIVGGAWMHLTLGGGLCQSVRNTIVTTPTVTKKNK
jgi:hypothetical protein